MSPARSSRCPDVLRANSAPIAPVCCSRRSVVARYHDDLRSEPCIRVQANRCGLLALVLACADCDSGGQGPTSAHACLPILSALGSGAPLFACGNHSSCRRPRTLSSTRTILSSRRGESCGERGDRADRSQRIGRRHDRHHLRSDAGAPANLALPFADVCSPVPRACCAPDQIAATPRACSAFPARVARSLHDDPAVQKPIGRADHPPEPSTSTTRASGPKPR